MLFRSGGIESIARDLAQDYAHKAILEESARAKAEQTTLRGIKSLVSAIKMHPEAKIEDTGDVSPEKFMEMRDKNPMVKAIYDYCVKRGWKYDSVADMGPEELYAAAGAFNKWPVAINTQARDSNIVKGAREKLLAVLRPKSIMKSQSISDAAGKAASIDNQGGMDADRLATDPDYAMNMLDAAKNDEELFKTQELIRNTLKKRK